MRVLRRPQFSDDLYGAYSFLAPRSPRAANRLLDEVEALIQLLTTFPEIGRPRDELRARIRSFRVRRFPHVLFYRHTEGQIELLRLLHGARQVQGGEFEE